MPTLSSETLAEPLFLTPSDREDARTFLQACAAIPCEIGEGGLDELGYLETQIVADMLSREEVSGAYVPDVLGGNEDAGLEIDSGGRIWAHTADNGTYRCHQVLPIPQPGSWYDPALDPSNAPALDPSSRAIVLGAQDVDQISQLLYDLAAGVRHDDFSLARWAAISNLSSLLR